VDKTEQQPTLPATPALHVVEYWNGAEWAPSRCTSPVREEARAMLREHWGEIPTRLRTYIRVIA
jgi:hypothetical protein